jgi:two-component system, OmpR family, response regulator ChvI
LSVFEEAKTHEEKIKSRRILLVDDEHDIALSFKICLEALGYSVDSYIDSVLALDNFKAGTYDLTILDMKMPKMNGYELYQKMREIDQGIKVCFMTANEIHEDDNKFFKMSSESNCLIRKPVTVEDLVTKINMQLAN